MQGFDVILWTDRIERTATETGPTASLCNLVVLGCVTADQPNAIVRSSNLLLGRDLRHQQSDIRSIVVKGARAVLASVYWRSISHIRSQYLRGVTRPLLLLAYILLGPPLILTAAVGGALVNTLLLALETVGLVKPTRAHGS